MMSAEDFKRLQWHSRRGMLELDVLLEPFTNNVFKTLSEQDQQSYEKLLACEDPDLFGWFMSDQRPADPDLAAMVDRVLNHTRQRLQESVAQE
ncbi:MAG: succinate dehydrogenase assembly factor 2 [Endozoicomonas sp.]